MDRDELFEALEQHVRARGDIELVLLKGHLILEQALNDLLSDHFQEGYPTEKLGLTFAKKIELFEALHGRKGLSDEIRHLKEINRIRNKLAHSLAFHDYHADLRLWACQVLEYTPKTIDRLRTYRNMVIKAFYFLTAFLHGYAKAARVTRGS